jgi:hypothetical protein
MLIQLCQRHSPIARQSTPQAYTRHSGAGAARAATVVLKKGITYWKWMIFTHCPEVVLPLAVVLRFSRADV